MRRCAVSARLPEPLEETLLAAGLTAVMEAATALLAHAFAGFYDRESHGE